MNKEVKQALMHLKIMTKDDKSCEAALELIENELKEDEEYESELITEQHRLFDLAKEQENELKELKEFAKIVSQFDVWTWTYPRGSAIEIQQTKISKKNLLLFKKVVEKYGKINN